MGKEETKDSSSSLHLQGTSSEDLEAHKPRQIRAPSFQLEPHSPVGGAPIVLCFQDLKVQTKTKVLLGPISGTITGGLWAIMGTSGSGKTTLLSAISLRLDRRIMQVSGTIHLNGMVYDTGILKSCSSYVMQDDLLHPDLSVEETLKYAAELRLGGKMTRAQREQRLQDVINLMSITHCAGTIVGDSQRKGISGGERKRLSIAIELLTAPRMIFLDEVNLVLEWA